MKPATSNRVTLLVAGHVIRQTYGMVPVGAESHLFPRLRSKSSRVAREQRERWAMMAARLRESHPTREV